jgi:hypothetical protein
MTTSINKLKLLDNKEPETFAIDLDSLPSTIMDLSLTIEIRLEALEIYHKKFGSEETTELITKLGMMYTLSGTTLIKNYLYDIVKKSSISNMLKLMAAKSLSSFNDKDELGYDAIDFICQDLSDIPTPVKIESVSILINSPLKKYQENSKNYFCKIINDDTLGCDFRYKTILSLENITSNIYFITEACLVFLANEKNMTLYRILSGQCLLQKCKITDIIGQNIENVLLSFAKDADLDYNLRADAADVLLQLGSESNKIIARDVIMILGRIEGNVRTIFDNAQNVHVDDIEESVLEIIVFLSSLPMMTLRKIPITWEYVKLQIDNLVKKLYVVPVSKIKNKPTKKEESVIKQVQDHIEKINISLNRISMDRALYSKYNCTILNVLMKVWTYINQNEHETEMKNCLLQELVDMSGTCSSGFMSRIVNSISGFGQFNLRMSFRDQIIANFTGRLNAKAMIIKDLDFQEKVLSEMTVTCSDYQARKNFLKFFREEMLNIREEMYLEFNEHIDDCSFDLYFRCAISNYEGVR